MMAKQNSSTSQMQSQPQSQPQQQNSQSSQQQQQHLQLQQQLQHQTHQQQQQLQQQQQQQNHQQQQQQQNNQTQQLQNHQAQQQTQQQQNHQPQQQPQPQQQQQQQNHHFPSQQQQSNHQQQHPQPSQPHPQQQQSQQLSRRREIYRYSAPEPLFASSWSNKIYPDKKFRMVVGTVLEDDQLKNNKIYLIELDETVGELVKRAAFHVGFPSAGLQFTPRTDPSVPELIASATNHLKIYRYNPDTKNITEECELFSTKSNAYSAPLTSLDWNEVEPTLVGTSSIDTTCTIWNVEVGRAVSQTSPVPLVRGTVKTQLIAHERPVHDIAFTRMDNGKDNFATAGADGSVRLFDLRSLQHSTIMYEDVEKRSLNRVAWNKVDPTKLATVAHESNEVVILDVRSPCRPMARFSNHRGSVNGIAWAPHSNVHICTGSSDRQALIWQMNHSNKDEPILAYNAEGEINQIHWANNFNQWICICFSNHLEILRV